MTILRTAAAVVAVALIATACGGDDTADDDADTASGGDAGEVTGTVDQAGSSTVFPVAQGVQELYAQAQPGVTVNLDSIGSGGGIERFCVEAASDIANASRPIKDEEVAQCEESGVDFIEVRVGTDALTMVTSPETEYLDCLTQEQIIQVFGPEGADTWDEVVDGAPADPITVFSPGTDSGTYDFMVEDVMGTEGTRQDYSDVGEADQQTVQGVREGVGTWGYFGIAYFTANAEGLKPISYDGGEGCVEPTVENAAADEYLLTRPLFMYVSTEALATNPAVADYVTFFLDNANDVVDQVGYVRATDEALEESRAAVTEAVG